MHPRRGLLLGVALFLGVIAGWLFLVTARPVSAPLAIPAPALSDALDGTEWILASLNSAALAPETNITLAFESDHLTGYAGCNWYGGTYVAAAGSLTLRATEVTVRGCDAPRGVLPQEEAYLQALWAATTYHREANELTLGTAADTRALVFARRQELALDPRALLGTQWQLVALNDHPLLDGSNISLAFAPGAVSGNAGCRSFTGTYQARTDHLRFNLIQMTGDLCRSDKFERQEAEYTTALSETTHYRLAAGQLELLTAPGRTMRFRTVPANVEQGDRPLREATPTLAPFAVNHNPGVADLLRNPPAPDQLAEVDAYFSGAGVPPQRTSPSDPQFATNCPQVWGYNLTDRPFMPLLRLLRLTANNPLPDNAPWLIAAIPSQSRPGAHAYPDLPYHARLRGYLAPRFVAGCDHATRIFVVDSIVKVYEQNAPVVFSPALRLPSDYASWIRYADSVQGYSLRHPQGWLVSKLDDSTLSLADPLTPGNPIVVRVYAEELHYDPARAAGLPALLQGAEFGLFQQGSSFSDPVPESQKLAGFYVSRAGPPDSQGVSALFTGRGRTYEITLTYPTGFSASQSLLTSYTALVESLRLDQDPGLAPPLR